jgi:hypothetical protein
MATPIMVLVDVVPIDAHHSVITVSPDSLPVNGNNGNDVIWKLGRNANQIDIDFKGHYSPFQSHSLHIHGAEGQDTKAETIDKYKPPYKYPYKVTVKPKNGIPIPPPLDPHIIVNDGSLVGFLADDVEAVRDIGAGVVETVASSLTRHMNDRTSDEKRFLFPFGVQSISVDVKVEGIEVNIQVAGTTSA